MSELSNRQKRYLLLQKRHHLIVNLSRLLILILFLGLWEITSRLGMIDSFVFSSPAKIVRCFWSMVVTEVFSPSWNHTLRNDFKLPVRYRNQYSDRSYFVVQQKIIRNTGSLSGRVEQSSEIRPGTASYRLARSKPDNHYYCRNVRCDLWKHFKSVHQFHNNR